jgi:hypothetical protein
MKNGSDLYFMGPDSRRGNDETGQMDRGWVAGFVRRTGAVGAHPAANSAVESATAGFRLLRLGRAYRRLCNRSPQRPLFACLPPRRKSCCSKENTSVVLTRVVSRRTSEHLHSDLLFCSSLIPLQSFTLRSGDSQRQSHCVRRWHRNTGVGKRTQESLPQMHRRNYQRHSPDPAVYQIKVEVPGFETA